MATSEDREDTAEALRVYADYTGNDDLAILLYSHDNVFNEEFLKHAGEIADNVNDSNLFKMLSRIHRVMAFNRLLEESVQEILMDEENEPPTPENAGSDAILGGHPPTAQMTGTSVSTRPDHTPLSERPQPTCSSSPPTPPPPPPPPEVTGSHPLDVTLANAFELLRQRAWEFPSLCLSVIVNEIRTESYSFEQVRQFARWKNDSGLLNAVNMLEKVVRAEADKLKKIAPPRHRPRVIESMAGGPLLPPEDRRLGNRQAFKPSHDVINLNLQDSQEFLQTFSRRLEMYAEDTHNDTIAVQMVQLDPAELASRPESYIAKMREVARAVGDSRLHSIVDLTSDELDLLKMAWKMVRDYAAQTRNIALGIIRYMNSKSSFCSFRCLKLLVSDVEDSALNEAVRQYEILLRELHDRQNAIIRLEEASEETSQEDCCTVEQKGLPKDTRSEDSLRDESSAKDQAKDLHSGNCTEGGALHLTAEGSGTLLDNMASGQHAGRENASRDPGSQSHSGYTTSDCPKKLSDQAAEEEPPSLSAMMKELVTCIQRHAERTQNLSLMELVSDVSVPDHPDIQDLTSICLRCLTYAERSQNRKLFSNLLIVYSEVHFDALMDMLHEYVEHSTDDRLKTALSDVPLAWETIERVAHECHEETLKLYILFRHNTVEMLLQREKDFKLLNPEKENPPLFEEKGEQIEDEDEERGRSRRN
ncbi:hypothetical protein ACOMHN_029653 [Nucella lapillus]